ncbi:hypothetical protein AV656_03115 [Bhargavaea cecembensis]|uniref:Core-binding (CB) domain-containing protein n=1 Tax=Bhargavaea cecembensis TaxID=394098 RepID=A0A163GIC8_9BACL|nr:hypothetical protein AV656_03115 [Bhargavaea cecembensis]
MPRNSSVADLTILKALEIVEKQMRVESRRERTLEDYNRHVKDYAKKTGIERLGDTDINSIYDWLGGMNIGTQTRQTRLKCLRAFFER